jgi:hypothetical protein
VTLSELERYFAAAATSGTGPVAGLDQVFVSRGALSASERLAIYNRGYYYRLLDALASVFGETQRMLGAEQFERVGLAYLAHYPSEHPAVERVGRHFPGFLRERFPAQSAVVQSANLEWARLCALVAPNPTSIASAHELQPTEFPRSRLRFVPALQCLEAVAVWRAAHHVAHRALEPLEFQSLSAAMGGASMSQVCALFDTGQAEADAQRAFAVISGWFARQWVERVDVDGA